jgi:hypothetical protein
VNQSLAYLDDVNITVLDFPELPRLKVFAAFCLFCLHIIKTDTRESVLLRQSGLQFCNEFVGVAGYSGGGSGCGLQAAFRLQKRTHMLMVRFFNWLCSLAASLQPEGCGLTITGCAQRLDR